MPIRKRDSKKTRSGYTYQVYFPYIDVMGVHREYIKGGFFTKKDAQAHEAIMKAELIRYGEVFIDCKITFNDTFEEYMKVEGNMKYSKSTICYYFYTYEKYIKPTIGNRRISTLKYRDIQGFFNYLKLGLSTTKNIKKIFNVTFNYAIKNQYIKDNPMFYVRLNVSPERSEKKEIQIITKEQLDEFIQRIMVNDKHSPDYDNAQFRFYSYAVALYIGWYTGLRVSETFGLKKEDFDFEHNVIHIRRRLEYHHLKSNEVYLTERLKTKKSKADIPMVSYLKEGILKWFDKNPYEYVICDIYGRLMHPSAFQYRIRDVSSQMNIDFHYHCLRHSFTSNLVNNDVKPNIAKELVRHSDITTTLGVYTHIKEEQMTDVLEDVFAKEG